MKNELCVDGEAISRFIFVADAAVKIRAARAANGARSDDDGKEASDAFDSAESLWSELCARFKDDSEPMGE